MMKIVNIADLQVWIQSTQVVLKVKMRRGVVVVRAAKRGLKTVELEGKSLLDVLPMVVEEVERLIILESQKPKGEGRTGAWSQTTERAPKTGGAVIGAVNADLKPGMDLSDTPYFRPGGQRFKVGR